jgi:intracellular multiplication protein IcmB
LYIGDAQIVSLDLDEVAPKGGPSAQRQSGVMFMLGRQLVAGKFFMMPEDVKGIPDKYRDYHAQRIDRLRQDPKKLCVDEFHRASKGGGPVVEQFMADIKTAVRESRKWNLFLDFYSQTEGDFPDELVELATNIFILGAGSDSEINRLTKKFGLNEAARYALGRLTKPGKEGSSMIALFRTDEGTVLHRLMSTIGQKMLWAFSSTTEDSQVRNKLYDLIGVEETLKVLAGTYPGGIKPEIEKRRLKATEEDDDVIETLIRELRDKATRKPSTHQGTS